MSTGGRVSDTGAYDILTERTHLLQLQQVVAVAANEATTVEGAMQDALDLLCAYTGWPVAHVYLGADDNAAQLVSTDIWFLKDLERYAPFRDATHQQGRMAAPTSLPGLVITERHVIWLTDIGHHPGCIRADAARAVGLQTGVAVPVWAGNEIVAALEFFSDIVQEKQEVLTQVLNYIGTQLGRVVERHQAARKLERSEALFRSVIENSSDIVMIVNADQTMRYLSPSAERILGWRPEEQVGHNAFELVHPDDVPRVQAVLAEAVRDPGVSKSVEYRIRHRNGKWRYLEATGKSLLHKHGVEGLLASARDITERKRMEEALRSQAERNAMILQTAGDGFQIVDATGRTIEVNDAFCRMLGYSATELQSMSVWDWNAQWTKEELLEKIREIMATGAGTTFETRHRRKDGTIYDAEIRANHLNLDHQSLVFCSVRDITERRRNEESLQLQSSALEAAANGIVITDREGTIRWVNPAFARLTGYTEAEVIGQKPRLLHSGKHSQPFYQWMWETILAGKVWQGEMINRRKDGSLYVEEMTITPVRLHGGEVTHFIAIKQDVSQRKESEEALRQSNERLQQVLGELQAAQQQVVQQERLRALGTMASGIAHDFNNALSPILGFSELLLHRPQSWDDREKVGRYLRLIHTSAQDAGNVVRRLREFYRHREADEFHAAVDLNRVVTEAVALTEPRWRSQSQAGGVSIEVKTELQETPPLAGNEADLREVLTNLIFNAVEAMPDGGTITIRTGTEDQHALLEVSDTGIGMTDEVRKRCLEPFFTTKGKRGSGLGLSMVYGIIERHQGRIEIRSAPGKGTVFAVWLPAVALQVDTPAVIAPGGALTPLRLLVIEDEVSVRVIIGELLSAEGHHVTVAADGHEGLKKLGQGEFDVVIVDRAMPTMSGDQVAAAVKSTFPTLPVILLTGFGAMMEAAGEKPPGVDLVVGKPVTLAELRQALQTVTSR